jgi:hypothetical protein
VPQRKSTPTDVPNLAAHEDDAPVMWSAVCAACSDPNPQVRYAHYLALSETLSFDDVETHVVREISRRVVDHERIVGYAHGIMAWLRDQAEAYRDRVDETTGEILPWQGARQQTLKAMRAQWKESASA